MGGWLRITLMIRLSQPSLAGVGAGVKLGKIELCEFHMYIGEGGKVDKSKIFSKF